LNDTNVSENFLSPRCGTDLSKFDYPGMNFADPSTNMDVLQDFDFDSFLHQDGDANDNFNFADFGALDGNEIGAE
jgi:hypothetical protein